LFTLLPGVEFSLFIKTDFVVVFVVVFVVDTSFLGIISLIFSFASSLVSLIGVLKILYASI